MALEDISSHMRRAEKHAGALWDVAEPNGKVWAKLEREARPEEARHFVGQGGSEKHRQ